MTKAIFIVLNFCYIYDLNMINFVEFLFLFSRILR